MLACANISFLALQVCRTPVDFPRVLQHINSASKAFNFIHTLSQSILTLGQVLQSSMIRPRYRFAIDAAGKKHARTCRSARISRSNKSKHSMGRNRRCSCSINLRRKLAYCDVSPTATGGSVEPLRSSDSRATELRVSNLKTDKGFARGRTRKHTSPSTSGCGRFGPACCSPAPTSRT
jgi:hypothetical protein